ncbi:DUF3383 family protein [bacterium 1xD42-67]|nr:DUF3383 family protein [bacterium 1xD42-67]
MPNDVIVVVDIDAKPKGVETLDILLLSTEGKKDMKTYRDLSVINTDYPGKKVAKMAEALFNQGKTTLATTLIRKVRIAGIEAPAGDDEKAKATALVAAVEGIREKDDDWYILLTDQTSPEVVEALAAWAEASEPTEAELGAGIEDHRKLYFGQTTKKEGNPSNARAIVMYVDEGKLEEWADAAYLGNVGPFYPQSVTWKFKRPQGISVPDLTSGERDALAEQYVNFLTVEYKREYVKNGSCLNGEFIDVQIGADYIAKTMRENLYDIFLENATIGYTDEGFAIVADGVYKALNRAVDLGIIARDPESQQGVYTVVVPKRSEATDEQARSRQMPDIAWEALLEGAVHSVKVKGVLRATLSA